MLTYNKTLKGKNVLRLTVLTKKNDILYFELDKLTIKSFDINFPSFIPQRYLKRECEKYSYGDYETQKKFHSKLFNSTSETLNDDNGEYLGSFKFNIYYDGDKADDAKGDQLYSFNRKDKFK